MKRFNLLVSTLLLVFSASLFAHTGLKSSMPEDGAMLNEAPKKLEIVFRDEVKLVKVALVDAKGKAVEFGYKMPQEKGTSFSWTLPALPAGDYKVNWTAMGGDDHNVMGSFGFMVH